MVPGRVMVVIVHWYNIDDTCACLKSLARLDYDDFGVIIVNNDSADYDAEAVKRCLPTVNSLEAGANLGFTGGNNLGIREALSRGAEYVLLLNPDTLVEAPLLQSLVGTLQKHGPGLVGPLITFEHNRTKVWFAGGHYSKLLGFSYRERPLAPFAGVRETAWLNGCAMMIHCTVFMQIGLLREGLFLYCEDLDYCLRARRHGFSCLQIGSALVHHKVSASSGIKGRDVLSPLKAYYFARNYMLLVKYHVRGMHLLTAMLSQFTILPLYHLLFAIQSNNFRAVCWQYIRGLYHGLCAVDGPRPS